MSQRHFTRFSIYHVPSDAMGDFGARWLGWDCRTGLSVSNPLTHGWTRSARRYGFHATLKAPFRMSETGSLDGLEAATDQLAARHGQFCLGTLEPRWFGRFLALVPDAPNSDISDLAASCVRDIDPFRAPMTPQEAQKYAGRHLKEALTRNLHQWGYPYIFDAFRFHLTLTDRVPKPDQPVIEDALLGLDPLVQSYRIEHISLVGEDANGMFHEINRYALTTPPVGSDK